MAIYAGVSVLRMRKTCCHEILPHLAKWTAKSGLLMTKQDQFMTYIWGFYAKMDLLRMKLIFAVSLNKIQNSSLTVIITLIKRHCCVWDGDKRFNCRGRRDQGLNTTASYFIPFIWLSAACPPKSQSFHGKDWGRTWIMWFMHGKCIQGTVQIHAKPKHPGLKVIYSPWLDKYLINAVCTGIKLNIFWQLCIFNEAYWLRLSK